MYNTVAKIYSDYIPVDTIYKETRHYAFNIVNGMTAKILQTAGLVEAQYCHSISSNKELVAEILNGELNKFKREKLVTAITELDGETVNLIIDEYKREKDLAAVSAVTGAIVAAIAPSVADATAATIASTVVNNVASTMATSATASIAV